MICSDCGSTGSFISHVIIITDDKEEKETCFQCDNCGGSNFTEREEIPYREDLQLEIVPVEREWNGKRNRRD